ncbi:hypothetical protein AUEXF2481DRAFT_36497 [Aureobasidium subglaciale EXF-2481]|uniref:Uncharacterized protein n=1 Tax=Aureobasidium subglaciale (strain EXF-2481) TaxID=1043005 RepID=A0A074ZLB5_AURSE|nr:uncharacterized protein AUEXF2481DRAFT_36497 [Aureobasidium subglaciale EXF-2481]KEQ99191.1 hypothetical protein AUEXF2481DRAFT_36497 [Aureobasidium subglaciale EXF-2481]
MPRRPAASRPPFWKLVEMKDKKLSSSLSRVEPSSCPDTRPAPHFPSLCFARVLISFAILESPLHSCQYRPYRHPRPTPPSDPANARLRLHCLSKLSANYIPPTFIH